MIFSLQESQFVSPIGLYFRLKLVLAKLYLAYLQTIFE